MLSVRLEDLGGSPGTSNNQSTGSWLSAWDWQRGPQSLMFRERALMKPIGSHTRQEDGLVFGEVGAGCPRYFSRSAYPAWSGQIHWCVERKWSLCALSAPLTPPCFLSTLLVCLSSLQMSPFFSSTPNASVSGKPLHFPWPRYSLKNSFRLGQLQQARKLLSQVVSPEICLHFPTLCTDHGGPLCARAAYRKYAFCF